VASAGLYAILHLAADRQPHQHPTTLFFTGWMPFLLLSQQCQSTEGKVVYCYIIIDFHLTSLCSVLSRNAKSFLIPSKQEPVSREQLLTKKLTYSYESHTYCVCLFRCYLLDFLSLRTTYLFINQLSEHIGNNKMRIKHRNIQTIISKRYKITYE